MKKEERKKEEKEGKKRRKGKERKGRKERKGISDFLQRSSFDFPQASPTRLSNSKRKEVCIAGMYERERERREEKEIWSRTSSLPSFLSLLCQR